MKPSILNTEFVYWLGEILHVLYLDTKSRPKKTLEKLDQVIISMAGIHKHA
jgi:hypothetical protein